MVSLSIYAVKQAQLKATLACNISSPQKAGKQCMLIGDDTVEVPVHAEMNSCKQLQYIRQACNHCSIANEF